MMKPILIAVLAAFLPSAVLAQGVLIPMDESQTDHLKAYGAVYWALERGMNVDWLLNYRGGSFLAPGDEAFQTELRVRGVSFEAASSDAVRAEAERPDANTSVVRLEKAPKIAVYAPDQTLPWDDAVLLALTYAEIPYEQIYDRDVLGGRLSEFEWVHLHHEDFTGQYGKFYGAYHNHAWYQEEQRLSETTARDLGYDKVPHLKLDVARRVSDYVMEGGFLFAMCSGTNTFDIALAAHATDIVPAEIDGDPADPDATTQLDFSETFAFREFTPNFNAYEYSHGDIDDPPPAELQDPVTDYFTLFDFSAKWDPVPTMLTQNHVASIRGFMGQTTMFRAETIKPGVTVLAESPVTSAVRYLYGPIGEGFFAFYGGHDPEDYKHLVGDPPTELELHKNSPGYRLILNNVLFPAAEKQPQKT